MINKRIIIADDDNKFIDTVVSALKEYSITSVNTPEELYAKLNDDYHLLLLDMVFDESKPEVFQGLDILPFIKKQYPGMLVIIMTNHYSSDVAVKSFNLGATDYINKKNINWIEWKNRLKNYLGYAQYQKGDIDHIKIKFELYRIENALKIVGGRKNKAAKMLKKTPDWMLYIIKKKALPRYPELFNDLPTIKKYYKLI